MTETVASLAGARVRIFAQLKNVSDRPIEVDRKYVGGVDLNFGFHLSNDRDAKPVVRPASTNKISSSTASTITLQPGGLTLDPICLSCLYGGLAHPGNYSLYLSHRIESNGETLTVNSNEITFRVVPKQGPGAPIPLAIELSLPKTAVGESALLAYDVTLINRSNHDLDCSDMYMDNVDQTYRLQIVDADGRHILPFHHQMESGEARGCILPFGGSKHWEASLIPSAYPFLAPGAYTLRIVTSNPDDPHAPMIQSNPVRLTVAPKSH